MRRFDMTWAMGAERTRRQRCRTTALTVTAVVAQLLLAASVHAAPNVSHFSVTPSTTEAGGHPSLSVSISFDPASADVRQIGLHLPAGLTADGRAAPFCPRRQLLSDLCDLRTKVGTVTLVGEALGFEAEAVRNIYNLKPSGAERLRLGVPVFGTLSRGGVALTLPVTARPDNGLDLSVAGPPREVAGYAIRIKQVGLRIQGVIRKRTRRGLRRRPLLTNPRSCAPANTTLDVLSDAPPTTSTKLSSFTPTGCTR